MEEFRQAVAALRLVDSIREDAKEALELALRAYEQTLDDHERADADFRRAWELLTAKRNRPGQGPKGLSFSMEK